MTLTALNDICVTAPIKLNLNLHVVGLNQQNYHLLQGVTVFATDGDRLNIAFSEHDTDSLTLKGQFSNVLQSENINQNLVMQAINKLRENFDFPILHITLEKNIPIQAGYGGGSSDAAAALKGIIQLCKLQVTQSVLTKIAQELGADVPMCLYGKPCLIENIGDQITPLSLTHQGYFCVLLRPNIMSSTPKIFAALNHKINPPMVLKSHDTEYVIDYALHQGRNDLYQAALTVEPILAIYLHALQDTKPIKADMSGSGSGFFALYSSKDRMQNAYETLRHQFCNDFIM
ncbi:MAG: 4-diphosphocytidyl-2-C-methyl-D-erythritol kinase, partial [Dasania sp.]